MALAAPAPIAATQPSIAPNLQPFVDSGTLAGAVVLVADTNGVLALETVGWMDVAGKRPMRTDCLFWIASQSKPITAAALMILVDEGKVSTDDPVEKYLPEFKDLWVAAESDKDHVLLKRPRHPILVREILSHTSGLPFKSPLEQPTLDLFPLEARVRSYAMMPLLFEPGTQSKYSNAGINTAARIVEVVAGMPFEKFLDDRILKPLGMKDTTFWPDAKQLRRLAKAYRPNASKDAIEECAIDQLKYPLDDPSRQPMPAGGLFSTAEDVSLFYRMLANNGTLAGRRILSESAVRQMTSDQSGEARSGYGFGIGVKGDTITHGGAYNTASAFDRERNIITVFLGQHAGWIKDGKDIIPAFQKAAADAFGPPPSMPPPPSAGAGTDAHRIVGIPGEAPGRAVPASRPAWKRDTIVFKEPGRYGGWPANHGLWQWGDELVVGFTAAFFKHATNDHAIDRSKPSHEWQARSMDGGLTWRTENSLPFSDPGAKPEPSPLGESLDFTAPDFALMFRFGSLHVGPSWFYVSTNRCRTWRGPFSFAVEGIERIAARTDLVPLGKRDCLMFGSAAKADGKEGRVFCARTTDGGLRWKLVSLIGPEPPAGFAIMPSSVRLPGGAIITAIRHGGGTRHSIDAWRSDDDGQSWTPLGDATPDIGGNPPSLVRLQDGRLCLTYGYRRKPCGVRARISGDEGRSWGPEIILRDDGPTGDLGYPRSVVRPDGKVLTIYYFNGPRDEDRAIEATLWDSGRGTNSIGMTLVPIGPGSFLMGQDGPRADYRVYSHPAKFDDADWDERPAHRVTITAPFLMSATEVTNEQYEQFDPSRRAPREKSRVSREGDAPAVNVSWHDAVRFCEWLSAREGRPYRLPTEAEWEYACRAGTTTLFHTGDSLPARFHKWVSNAGLRDRYFKEDAEKRRIDGKLPPEFRDPPGEAPLRVARTPANAWGLFDMHGNVEEWCLDWYGPYEAADQRDPAGRSAGDFRVARGGSHSALTRLLRSANRAARLPETRNDMIGFRVVLAQPPAGQPLPPPPPPLNATNVGQAPAPPATAQQTKPFFSGPKPFVKIPPDSFGPLFSTHNHSPAIAQCPNGDLLAVWYSCVDESGAELCVLASRLRHGSSEWEPASPFWDGPDINDHAPKLWFDGVRTLFFFARGLSENIVRTSPDSGATWSKAKLLQPHGEFANRPIRTREGFLIVPHDNRSTSLVISRDGGATWTFPTLASKAHDYRPGGKGWRLAGIHNGIVQLQDGHLMAAGRFDQSPDQERFGFKTPISLSSDWGATWSYEASPFPAISSVQRPILMRLREGPLLFCSFTDQWRDFKKRKGMPFRDSAGKEFVGHGLFAALSLDDGKTWPARRLITPGGPDRTVNGIDRVEFTLGETSAEPCGYLAACQDRDGMIQLITSKNHYSFNLPWLRQ